ncbi:MAG: hypothetical protein HY879_24355, partial [Deltaproteobacteria bacterium]|nr:hypothetical protein [Deltaproteobacteria bacterium]
TPAIPPSEQSDARRPANRVPRPARPGRRPPTHPAEEPDIPSNCCGGGGGFVALGEENLDFRMKSAKVKVDQVNKTGAKILTTACENCHTQLSNLNDHYQMGVEVKFLSSMVADALVQ